MGKRHNRARGADAVARAAKRGAWRHPAHLQVDVRSLMDLCLYWEGKTGGEFPAVFSAMELLFASHAPSDEARYWVAVYERLRVLVGLPRFGTVHDELNGAPASAEQSDAAPEAAP